MTVLPSTRLRQLILEPGCVMAVGAADAFAARMIARAGFDAVYMTGFGTSLSRLGMPDVGLLTATEMVDNAHRIVEASGLPVLADADTGYGNPINVRRTVREFEKAGVAGVHIEDQVSPKRCGHLAGTRVIPVSEMVAKIKAACDSRHGDMVIVARTDAASIEGLESAFERCDRYREAGAEMLFIDGLVGREPVERAGRYFKGRVPLLYNVAASGKTPDIPAKEMGELGYKLAIYGNYVFLAAIPAIKHMLAELKSKGTIGHLRKQMADFKEFTDICGLPEIQELEKRYEVPEDQRVGL